MDNEELVKQIQAGKDRKKNLSLLWEQNQGIIGMMVHQLTGLQSYEDGFEDAKQQSYFGLLEAIEGYKPEIGVKFFTYAEGKIKKLFIVIMQIPVILYGFRNICKIE